MSDETLKIMRHIFDARIDNADLWRDVSARIAWKSARDIVEYALMDNIECLKEFDYLLTKEDARKEFEQSKRANDQPSNFVCPGAKIFKKNIDKSISLCYTIITKGR